MNTHISNAFSTIRNFITVLILTLTIIITLPGLAKESFAEGGIDWGSPISITQAGQVVDCITVNGIKVDSLYAPRNTVSNYNTDTTYCCAAFVKRFYRNVFGVEVSNLYPGSTPIVTSGSFTKTSEPRVGDIAANAEHWAIVKSVSDGKVTVIEQNAWNSSYTSAMVGRVLYSNSGYWYWRWSGSSINSSDTINSKSSTTNKNLSKKNSSGATAKVKKTYSFSYMIQNPQVSSNNATIYTKVNNPNRCHVQQVGCNIYDSTGRLIKTTTEKCSRQESVFNIWYDLNQELGLTLSPKTTYQYVFFIAYDGMCFSSQKQSFTTN